MAARYERGLFDPEAAAGRRRPSTTPSGRSPATADLQEGISAEASSLAGHQKLGNLVLLWDDNHISIEGDTETAVSEDTAQALRGLRLARAARRAAAGRRPRPARAVRRRSRPRKAETGRAVVHRDALDHRLARPERAEHRGRARLGARRGRGRGHQARPRLRPGQALRGRRRGPRAHPRRPWTAAREAHAAWEKSLRGVARPPTPSAPADFDRIARGRAARGLGGRAAGLRGGQGRRHPCRVRQGAPGARRGRSPSCGAAPPTSRARTTPRSTRPRRSCPKGNPLPEADPYGRTIHFGIREHSMAAEMNGIALHGNTRIYGGTFLVFSDYMRNAVRLSALMHLPVTYVWTHDSIGLGEDGPTHQPVEHLASLRAIPGPERRAPGRRQRDRDRLARDPQRWTTGSARAPRTAWRSPGRACRRYDAATRTRPRAATSCSRPRAATPARSS